VLDCVREHEQLLHFLYAAPVGLVQTSLDGEIELINSVSAKLLLPVAPDRMLGNLFEVLASVAPDLRQQVKLSEKLSCKVCEGLRFAVQADPHAHATFVSFSLTKIDGRRLIAVLSDITDLVDKERALKLSEALYQDELLRSQERLERKVDERTSELQCAKVELEGRAIQAEAASKAKSAFLANMSHEIRTPLNAILGNVELLRRDRLAPEQAQRIEQMKVAAEHLLGALSDVLELSKVESGELTVDEVEFRLDDVLSRVRAITSHAAASKGLTLQIEAKDVPQALHGDPGRLTQILVNYMSNAVKFTDQGGVRLDVRLIADAACACELEFAVRDTGIGIAPGASAQLFGAFERGVSDRPSRGAGLGLAINARLADS
jgi:signal transduction histidine kinase